MALVQERPVPSGGFRAVDTTGSGRSTLPTSRPPAGRARPRDVRLVPGAVLAGRPRDDRPSRHAGRVGRRRPAWLVERTRSPDATDRELRALATRMADGVGGPRRRPCPARPLSGTGRRTSSHRSRGPPAGCRRPRRRRGAPRARMGDRAGSQGSRTGPKAGRRDGRPPPGSCDRGTGRHRHRERLRDDRIRERELDGRARGVAHGLRRGGPPCRRHPVQHARTVARGAVPRVGGRAPRRRGRPTCAPCGPSDARTGSDRASPISGP